MRVKHCQSLLAVLLAAAPASAQLFGPDDPILACDPDTGIHSKYPAGEAPWNVVDQDDFTKYLNFGQANTGAIITPFYGSTVVRSMQFTTANDAVERDPATWELYGTNDPIVDEDNSTGDGENWTLIASGDADLPDDRYTRGPIYNFANATAYESYKVIFTSLKDPTQANSVQLADVSLYTDPDGAGDQILDPIDFVLACGWFGSESQYPGNENVRNAIDGDDFDKYLNFGRENSGFIISRADGAAVVVEQFTIVTANDYSERDPTSWELYGTNDPIVDEDNSTGEGESWTLIDSGPIDLPEDRNTAGDPVTVNNSTAYTGYKMLFPTVKDPSDFPGDSMQIAEIIIEGQGGNDCFADCNGDSKVDTQDFLCYLGKWSAAFQSGNYDPEADCNGDSKIDTQDFICFLNAWVAGC